MLESKRRWARVCICLLCLLLTDCNAPVVSPTPRATAIEVTPETAATFTAAYTPETVPSVSYTPTQTATLEPTFTETPTDEPTPVRTATMFVTLTRTPTPTPESTQVTPVPPVDYGVIPDLAYFYIEPGGGVPCSALVPMFNYFIGTKGREGCRDTVRALGRTFDLQYLRFDGFQDLDRAFDNPDTPCTRTPFGNQVAYKRGDACLLREIAQDWLLRRPDGSFIRTAGDFIMTDPANLEWRAYFISRALEMQTIYGWNGLFLDNVSASRNNVGLPLRDYPDDKTYQDAIADFLATIRISFASVHANMIYQTTSSVWYRYGQFLDGQMEESFAVNWSSGYLSVTSWTNQLIRIETTLASGIEVILVSQGTQGDLERQQFAFASYLLIAEQGAHFRYSQDGAGYSQIWDYDTYHQARLLGQPLTLRYQLPDGSWERRFQFGTVQANPSTHIGTITVINP